MKRCDTGVSHFLVAEIKGSEQQAARSGLFLAIARPQPPPGIGVLALPGVWFTFLPFLEREGRGEERGVLPSVPTLALLCCKECLQMDFCHVENQSGRPGNGCFELKECFATMDQDPAFTLWPSMSTSQCDLWLASHETSACNLLVTSEITPLISRMALHQRQHPTS